MSWNKYFLAMCFDVCKHGGWKWTQIEARLFWETNRSGEHLQNKVISIESIFEARWVISQCTGINSYLCNLRKNDWFQFSGYKIENCRCSKMVLDSFKTPSNMRFKPFLYETSHLRWLSLTHLNTSIQKLIFRN